MNIRERLFELQDLRYKEFHSKLCSNTKYEIIGVRVPILRSISKDIIKENYKDFLDNYKPEYYEEIILKALVIGNSKINIDETIFYLRKFIPLIDNWAVCDTLCSNLKITNKNKEKMWKFLQKYAVSIKEYEVRFAIVMFLNYYIDKEYLNDIFYMIDNVNNNDYYVKMAIAWFISIAYIKEKNITLEYLKFSKIDDWTFNKSIQKIIESYRVSDEEKSSLKKLKK